MENNRKKRKKEKAVSAYMSNFLSVLQMREFLFLK
jgi:hypothetical protein